MGQVYFHHSSEENAPSLTSSSTTAISQPGGVLHECLYNGFNLASLSYAQPASTYGQGVIVITGSDKHWRAGDWVEITNNTTWNGIWQILWQQDDRHWIFDTRGYSGAYKSGGFVKSASFGWGRPYTHSGSDISVFRASAGLRHYLQVDDSSSYATARVYETMTAYNSGTNPSSVVYWKKSNTSTSRDWWVIGDDRFFYFVTHWQGSSTYACIYGFGEILPIAGYTGDLHHTVVFGGSDGSPVNTAADYPWQYCQWQSTAQNENNSRILRNFDDTNSDQGIMKFSYDVSQGTEFYHGTYPDRYVGGLNLFPVYIAETDSPYALRGRYPGLYVCYEDIIGEIDYANWTLEINGERFLHVLTGATSDPRVSYFIQMTGDWRA